MGGERDKRKRKKPTAENKHEQTGIFGSGGFKHQKNVDDFFVY